MAIEIAELWVFMIVITFVVVVNYDEYMMKKILSAIWRCMDSELARSWIRSKLN